MQASARGPVRPPIGIAFESDLGNRIDAVLGVAMLNGLIVKGEARRIALAISRPSLPAAQLADVLVAFYSGRPVGGFAMIGMPEGPLDSARGGPAAPDASPGLAAILSKKGADGAPVHTSNIARLLDTADNAVLIRNVLLGQHDQNGAVVLAGPATGLARLLALNGSRPQIVTKVKHLVVAAGAFPDGPADPGIKSDIASARTLFAEWPGPIVAVGAEVGAALPFPGASIDADLAWSPVHPVADAYRVFKATPYDAPASALAAILYAAHPDQGYFKLSERGTISVLDDGRTRFTPKADGTHQYLMVDPAQKDRVIKLYTELVSSKPAPRPGRRGGAE
jgi:hypothetical protein